MEKNKDAVAEDLIDLLKNSYTPWISKIFQDKVVPENAKGGRPMGGGSKTTAATYFKNQLTSLVNTLGETSPHYVRCIKPNMEKEAFLFDDDQVISQLRYSGMLDTIKIRKAGFDVRIPFDKFIVRYDIFLIF
jgi:myosin-7